MAKDQGSKKKTDDAATPQERFRALEKSRESWDTQVKKTLKRARDASRGKRTAA